MKHKVSELEGALLDAAVAKARGMAPYFGNSPPDRPNPDSEQLWRDLDGWPVDRFSTEWGAGGPIIGRELIAVSAHVYDNGPAQCCCWVAAVAIYGMFDVHYSHPPKRWYGATPLIAAMRAYVASKLGEEIDL